MTHEEAIHFAECLRNNWTIDFNDMEDFCKMAIDALKEQERIYRGTLFFEKLLEYEDEFERVVRCEECIYSEDDHWFEGLLACRCPNIEEESVPFEGSIFYYKPDDYCSYGERNSND